MRIFIYWNYKDRDSKKIYQFLNKSKFMYKITQDHDVYIYKKYKDFLLDESLCNEILNSDIIMFFTHGEYDAILKFRYIDNLLKKRYVFVDLENALLLKNKKVISVCCRSAKELGVYCVGDKVQSKFFIGFLEDLIYSEDFSDDFRSIVYKTYSNAFEQAFEQAYDNNWTAEKFVLRLKKYIQDMLTTEILLSDDRKLGTITGVSFHRKTAESLVALGETTQLIFK